MFDAAQFAGNGFMPDGPQTQGGSAQKQRNYNDKQQTVRALTVRQLHQALEQAGGNDAELDGKPITNVTMVGKVVGMHDDTLTMILHLDDGSGKVPVKYFASNEADDLDRQKRAEIREGIYVRIHGHVSQMTSEKHVIAFNVRPVADHNEVTFHLLQCIFQHAHFTKGSAGVDAGVQGGNAFGGAPAAAPAAAPAFQANGNMTAVQNEIYQVFCQPDAKDSQNGFSFAEVGQRLGNRYNEAQLKQAITFLVDEGHLYSTIDEFHHKACL